MNSKMENVMLNKIFEMQTELNDYVFRKNKLKDKAWQNLNMQSIVNSVIENKLNVNELPNEWLMNYSKAIQEELIELDEELLWKWWSKDEIDIQNIRVELIDILHFLISAMMCAGLDAEKVFDIYKQKHAINLKRQDTNYKKETKTEDDNRSIS